MSRLTELGSAISEIVKSSSLGDLACEYLEVGIDSVTENEPLQELPGISTVRAVFSVRSSISDKLLARKIESFLREFRNVTDAERTRMIERLESDPDYGRRAGTHLVEILDRIDGHRKPEMLARVFAAYAREQIDLILLQRLTHAIERIPDFEIKHVRKYLEAGRTPNPPVDTLTVESFISAGLSIALPAYDGNVYDPTIVCEKFVALELDRTNV